MLNEEDSLLPKLLDKFDILKIYFIYLFLFGFSRAMNFFRLSQRYYDIPISCGIPTL